MSLRHKVSILERRAERLKLRLAEQVRLGRQRNSYDRAELSALEWALCDLAFVVDLRRLLARAQGTFAALVPDGAVTAENVEPVRAELQRTLDGLRAVVFAATPKAEPSNEGV